MSLSSKYKLYLSPSPHLPSQEEFHTAQHEKGFSAAALKYEFYGADTDTCQRVVRLPLEDSMELPAQDWCTELCCVLCTESAEDP